MRPHVRFGAFTFAPEEGELLEREARHRLQPQVAALLSLFVDNPGRLFTHDELVDHLWPDVYVNPEALTQVMSRLRRALGETRGAPRHLETLHKRGYRFIGEVTLTDPTPPTTRAPALPTPPQLPHTSTFAPAPLHDQTTPTSESVNRRFPTLTLAAHPDLTRVGESVRLTPLALGEDVLLSRAQPGFRRHRNDPPRPLEDAFLSRTPITFRRTQNQPDAPIELHVPAGVIVHVDGVALAGTVHLSAARISLGVTLELADRVVLVLHESADPKSPSDDLGLLGDSYTTSALRNEIKRIAHQPVHVIVTGEALSLSPVANALARAQGSSPTTFDLTSPEPPVLDTPSFAVLHLSHDELRTHSTRLTTWLTRAPSPTRLVLLVARPDHLGDHDDDLIATLPAYVLSVAPLARRRADVAPLLMDTITRLAGSPWSTSDTEPWLPAPLVDRIVRHDFPGGLAELDAIARHLATLGTTGPIAALPLHLESRLPL